MINKIIKYCSLAFLSLVYYWPIKVVAQQATCQSGTIVGGTCVPSASGTPWVNSIISADTLSGAVTVILNILLLIVGLVAVIFIVIGGYQYITAGGSEENVEKAKKRVLNSLIGLAIVLLALALVRIVANLVSGDV